MKKIRTTNDLVLRIDDDLKWRKRELISLKFNLEKATGSCHATLLRSAICMLYAHWEGFVKASVTAYLSYVAGLGLKIGQLKLSMYTLCLRPKLLEAAKSKAYSPHFQLCQLIKAVATESANLPWKSALGHVQNLDFDSFQEVMFIAGIDSSWFDSKRALIDEKLVCYRHPIAHGEFREVDPADFTLLSTEVLNWLERVRTLVQNAAIEQQYLVQPKMDAIV